MKKTIIIAFSLLVISPLAYGQKIILVNGEAVEVKLEEDKIVEVVENKDNYMKGFEDAETKFFKKEEDVNELPKPKAKEPEVN